jgi:hypothetical protein
MDDKIVLELSKEQLESINTVLSVGFDNLKGQGPFKEFWPKEFTAKSYLSPPKDITVDSLLRYGILYDSLKGRWGITEFVKYLKKIIKDGHGEVFQAYVAKLFLPSKDREFTFNADFRKGVSSLAEELNLLPVEGKMYYVTSWASKGSNGDWVKKNLNRDNLPNEAWDYLSASKRASVLEYMICHGPEDVLPMIIPNIKNVNCDLYYEEYIHEYLEYLVELRTDFINGRIPKFKPMNNSEYHYNRKHEEMKK